MALVFTEGFDAYGSSNGSTQLPSNVATRRGWVNPVSNRSQAGRIDGFAASNGGTNTNYIAIAGTETTKTVGTAIYLASTNAYNGVYPFQLLDGTTVQMSVFLNSSRKLEVRRGSSTVLATGTTTMKLLHWYYLEFKTTINDTTGAYELRIDGVLEVSATSVDTKDTANTYWDNFGFRTSSTSSHICHWDDMYVTDTTGTSNTGFLGSVHVETIFPDADVTSQWTTSSGTDHFALVDDNPSDDDTTYVEDSTLSDRDLFDLPALSSATLTIYGVTSIVDQRVTDASSVDMKFVNVSNATTTISATQTITSQSATRYEEIYEEDPDAVAAWTKTTFEAAQFGFEIA